METPLEVQLALGRIFRILSRPEQPGDRAEYERCRGIVLDASEHIQPGWAPNWVRDRLRGASGQ